MKKISLFLLLLVSFPAMASWYCNEVASEKNGDTLNACGIGEAADEDMARKVALNNAYKELDLICSHSSDCSNRALEISPLRTECKKIETGYRCHRGITATITNKERDLQQKALLEEVFVPKKLVQVDGRNELTKSSIVDFDTNPEGATVHVDGVEVCKTPCSQEINQGEHKIIFERSGFDLVSKIHIVGSGRKTISQDLLNTYGYLSLKKVPESAVVKIDNKEITGRDSIRLSPNEHIVTIESKYNQPWHKKFEIEKGENLEFEYDAQALMAYLKISAVDSYNSPLEATIYVNGRKIPASTPNVISIPAGPNTITLTHKGHKDVVFNLDLDVGEKDEIKKKMTPSNEKDWIFYLGFGGNKSPVNGGKEDQTEGSEYSCCFLVDLSFQRMISKYLGLRIVYNFISNTNSDDKDSTVQFSTGTPNTFQNLLTDYTGHQIGLALPIYLHKTDGTGFYLGPEAGILNSKLVFKRETFDNTGVGTETGSAREDTFKQSYYGIVSGVEWMKENNHSSSLGWFILSGLRKYSDSSKSKVETKFQDEPSTFKGNYSFYFEGGFLVGF